MDVQLKTLKILPLIKVAFLNGIFLSFVTVSVGVYSVLMKHNNKYFNSYIKYKMTLTQDFFYIIMVSNIRPLQNLIT